MLRRSLILLVCLTALILSTLATPVHAAVAISGKVFRDYDESGVQAVKIEPPIAGIIVTAYDNTGAVVGTATTDAAGNYTLTVPNPVQVRIEFTGIPSYLRPGVFGTESSTTVTFVTGPASNVDLALANPGQYCQVNPQIATSCYQFGPAAGIAPGTGNTPAIISFPYNAGVPVPPPAPPPQVPDTTIATSIQVGATFGLGYQPLSNSLFTAAFMKRHAGFGPSGPGAIYRIDSTTNAVSTFTTLAAGADPHTPGNTNALWRRDSQAAFDGVGKLALGGLVVDNNANMLYTVNLADNQLYQIPIVYTPPAPPTAGASKAFAIPNNLCAAATDARPFGLGIHDGLIYVGEMCTAEASQSAADLRAVVYSFDPTNGGFTARLNFPMNYTRGCANDAPPPGCAVNPPQGAPWPGLGYIAAWQPWMPPNSSYFNAFRTQNNNALIFPQPIFASIVFDGDDMILGFRDRFADQSGKGTPNPVPLAPPIYDFDYNGISSGDILRACGSLTTGWVIENNSGCGAVANTAGQNTNQGPGGGEFYFQDATNQTGANPQGQPHQELALGGLTQLPSKAQVVATVFDPLNAFFTAGTRWFSNDGSGNNQTGYLIFANAAGNFGKANGLGGLQALCAPAPIEIGNRVWIDPDRNGIQDPGETPVAGVHVRLYDKTGVTQLAEAITDAAGTYYFTSNAAAVIGTTRVFYNFQYNQSYEIRLDDPADYATGGPLFGYVLTPNNKGSVINDSNGVVINNFPATDITVGNPGDNDHTFDFGFSLPAPTPTPTSTSTNTPTNTAVASLTPSNTPTLSNPTATLPGGTISPGGTIPPGGTVPPGGKGTPTGTLTPIGTPGNTATAIVRTQIAAETTRLAILGTPGHMPPTGYPPADSNALPDRQLIAGLLLVVIGAALTWYRIRRH